MPGCTAETACTDLKCAPAPSPATPGMKWRDALVVTWAGLRGAVGLVLALSVRNSEGAPSVSGSCWVHWVLVQLHAISAA